MSLVSLMLMLIVLEAVTRLFVPAPRVLMDPQVVAEYSPTLRWEMKPNQRTFTLDAPVTTNSHGFRGAEFSIEKAPNTFRIICLGDSITFGLGTKVDATYPRQLEVLLNERYRGKRFEVINMGVAGYNTRQELIVLKAKGMTYNPDLAIVGFYWNDILGNDKPLPWEPNFVPESPIADEGGGLGRPVAARLPKTLRDLLRSWRTLHIAGRGLDALRELVRPSGHPYRVHFRALVAGDDAYLKDSWANTEGRLKELVELGEEHKLKLVLLILPDALQMSERYVNLRYQSEVATIATRIGMPYVDVLAAFRAQDALRSPFFHGDNAHPNEIGHAIIARELGRFLAAHGLIPLQ